MSLPSRICAQADKPAAPVSRIHQMFLEDQRENPGNTSEAQMYQHADARRAEVRKMLDAGQLTDARDFADAALLFQHSRETDTDNFLVAHVLAMEAVIRGDDSAKWLAAATLDRYLQNIGKSQVFGTQYTGVKSTANKPGTLVDPHVLNIQRTLEPYNPSLLTDAMRKDFCVPDAAQQQKNLAILNTGHRPDTMRIKGCSK